LFVHHDDGAIPGATLLVPQAIVPGDLALGVPVGQLSVGQASNGRGPGPVGSDVVAVDAQYLGILLLEPVVDLPEGDSLAGSTRGKVEHVKG